MKWTNKGHELDEIGNRLKSIKRIYVYGAGNIIYAKDIITLFQGVYTEHLPEVVFIDRDEEKQKTTILEKEVISPETFFNSNEQKDEHIILVGTTNYRGEVFDIFKAKGYKVDFDIFDMFDFMYYYLMIYFAYAKDMLYSPSFSVIVTTVCNLNCEYCLNFTNDIKNHRVKSFDEVKGDIDAIFNKFDYVDFIHISGGETFTYKALADILCYINEAYCNKLNRLSVTTNGTLIPSTELLDIISKCNVEVILDDYRESVETKFDAVYEMLKERNIETIVYKNDKWIDIKSDKMIDESQAIELHDRCRMFYATVRDKKICRCNYNDFAVVAEINEEDADDYLDLTADFENYTKIAVEYRYGYTKKGYLNFCRKCNGFVTINEPNKPVAKQIR